MPHLKLYLQPCHSWVQPLGPGLFTSVTWSTLGWQANEEAHARDFGGCRLQMDLSPSFCGGHDDGGSVWLERPLWLDSDCDLRSTITGSQKESLFQVYWDDSKTYICWVLGPRECPFFSLVAVCLQLLICLHADRLFQLPRSVWRASWHRLFLAVHGFSLGIQKGAFLSHFKILGQWLDSSCVRLFLLN